MHAHYKSIPFFSTTHFSYFSSFYFLVSSYYLTKKDKAADVPAGSREDILEERFGCVAP